MTPTTDDTEPVDYVVIEFPSPVTGPADPVALEVAALDDTELIHVLDLVALTRDADGTTRVIDVDDLGCGRLTALNGHLTELLSTHDVARIGATLSPGSAGLAVLFENTWAGPLRAAARDCGASVVATGRVPQADVRAAFGAPRGPGRDRRTGSPGGDLLRATPTREA
jgi:uncharacterized membrane protein